MNRQLPRARAGRHQADARSIRLSGYVFVYDPGTSSYARNAAPRTRILPLGDHLIINVAPADTNIENVKYVVEDNRLVVTDGAAFRLDINEFGPLR